MKNTLIFLSILLPLFSYTQGDFIINQYHVDITLDEASTAFVTETIDLRFLKKSRGIIREIPTRGKFNGHRQSMRITDVHVEAWKYTVKPGSDYEIKIGDKDVYLEGKQQYIISYKASNALLNFENHEEFYWTLIGGEWDVDIINGSYSITLPSDVELTNDDFHIFSGQVGDDTSYGTIEKEGKTFTGKSLATLGKGKALTAGIRLPKGYFFGQDKEQIKELAPAKVYTKDRTFPIPILIVLSFIGSFLMWGRNKKSKVRNDQYYPPNNMTSAEVGTYYDWTVHDRDLLSLIPFWGEKGYLKVRVHPIGKRNDIYLEKQSEIPNTTAEHEKYLFNHIFAFNDIVYIDELSEDFYQDFQSVKKKLKEEIKDEKYSDPEALRIFHSNLTRIMVPLLIILGFLCIGYLQWIGTGMGIMALALTIFVISFLRPKRSKMGQELHNQLEDFKYTVQHPNQEELQRITAEDPRYFDKIFPYAVAFGLDRSWLKSFEDIGRIPDWYYYQDQRNFGYGDFSNDFNLKKIQNKMIVPPQASSDSSSFGGSGGGFSGGGFGGGGGSSW